MSFHDDFPDTLPQDITVFGLHLFMCSPATRALPAPASTRLPEGANTCRLLTLGVGTFTFLQVPLLPRPGVWPVAARPLKGLGTKARPHWN